MKSHNVNSFLLYNVSDSVAVNDLDILNSPFGIHVFFSWYVK